MNIDKAREHFSAYYEGSMDRGLRQAFERRLQEDAQMAAEYRAFESLMGELQVLTDVSVAIPEDLHERIAARVDRHVWDAKQGKPAAAGWFSWLRVGLVGVGVASVAGLAFMQGGSFGSVNQANVVPISGNIVREADVAIDVAEKGILVSISSSSAQKLLIRGSENESLKTVNLAGKPLVNYPIQNEGASTRLIRLEVDGSPSIWVAIPGSKRIDGATTEGSVKDLAKAIAGRVQIPVVLHGLDADQAVRWTSSSDPMSAVDPLREANLKSELRGGNQKILWIFSGKS